MAIKDLFSKQKSQSVEFRGANKKSVDEFRQDVESGEEIKQIRIEDSLVIPDLNYASASSFVKYGSAKKYYEDAIKRIYSQYPYDGSSAEKIAFRNQVTQLERHILDNQYPKSTGFAVFSPNGWGTSGAESEGFYSSSLPEYITALAYKKNQIWDTDSKQQQSFRIDFSEGITTEFWLKKGAFGVANSREAIFDVRDPVNSSASFGAYVSSSGVSNLYAYYNNASHNFTLDLSTGLTASDTDWHHYAIAYSRDGNDYVAKLYIDGEFADSATNTNTNVATTGTLKTTIGALGGDFFNTASAVPAGYGKLSGSIDEFRFWQEARDAQQIGRNYFSVVNGGGNTDTSKVNDNNPLKLSAYYKFNEGKTGAAATDAVVLDYSGRLVNGSWTGYVSNSRDTGSAITQAGVGIETGDPIIYSAHPEVITLSDNLEASGTQYDAENVGSLQDSMPLWILDEDKNSGGQLANLLQVMGSYLDSLYLQVTQIPKFHEADYQKNNSVAANPHNNRLLTSLGFDVPEIFIDKQVLETITNQDDKRKFEDKLNEIKNLVYKNIYNNLTYINKSKGTTKSVRNLLRCYGIDDDLFNFNIYADQAQYFLEDDFKNSSVKFDSLDLTPFANTQNSEGVIYNFSEAGNTNSSPFISGSSANLQLGFTVETNAIFPKTPPTYKDTVNLTEPAIVTASVFGVREAFDSTSTTVPTPDDANLSVRVIKQDNTAKFQLSSSIGSGFLLESDRFYDVYDNSRWSLSVRIKYNAEPFSDAFTGKNYTVEFNGYNYIQDIEQNSFALTSSVARSDAELFVAADKRVYAGSERTNITGTLSHRSNMKLLSVLAWADYVESDELKSHARDVTSFGRARPYKNSFIYSGDLDTIYIPKFDTLAMNLGFNQVSSSDGSGKFTVPDLSSGSVDLVNKYGADDYSAIVSIQNTAQGANFPASSDVKDIQYLNISTQQIPENLNTDNMIQILENDDDLFFLDNRPVKYFFSLEASMYDTISREMLKTFAGVLDYASMIGSPVVDYQVFNKELRLARENFYERVENTPDLEKYVSLYKFLDSAIESVLFNLMPASANSSDRVRTMVESHIFERNATLRPLPPGRKVDPGDKFNGKNLKVGPFINPAAGLTPSSNFYTPTDTGKPQDTGGAATLDVIDISAGIEVSPGSFEVDAPDFTPFKSSKNAASKTNLDLDLNQFTKKTANDSIDTDGLNAYYKIRAKRTQTDIASTTVGDQLSRNSMQSIKQRAKFLDKSRVGKIKGEIVSNQIGKDDAATRVSNVILPIVQKEEAKNLLILTKKEDPTPNGDLIKKFVSYDTEVSESTSDLSELKLKQNNLPIKFTNAQKSDFFGESSASIHGHHIDTYYDLEDPLQGPFTEQHVGGYKHRHTEVGQSEDRPELYKIDTKSDTEVVIFNPRTDRTASSYDFDIPRVKFSREEFVKRVYNTKNIKNTTGSSIVGNFDRNYEIALTNGRNENNLAFVQANGFDVTGSESTAVTGVLDFTLPDRSLSDGTFNKTVIVNRFSAPGEVATLSEGYLDVESGEYSAYNAMPYRNRQVVDNLNEFLSIPSAFGGYQSGSTVTASFHKVQRNRVDRLKTDSSGNTYTGSFEDNGFFSYGIPKKDFGYSWISSSADPSLSMDAVFGFASASTGISFYSGALRGDNEDTIINFANYSADNIGVDGYHYELNEESNLVVAPTAYTDGAKPTSASIYFLNLNGPYTFPTFKQSRNSQHPVARYLRENNFILAGTDGSTRVQHSPVTTKYKSVVHLLKSEERVGDKTVEKDLILTYPFASEYDYYGDYYDAVNNKLTNAFNKSFKTVDKTDSLLYNISGLYTGKSVLNKVNKISLTSLFYGETVYPKETNAYLSKARDRSRFEFNWRDDLANRVAQIQGSQEGQDYGTYSMWAMDVGTDAQDNTHRGELLNIDQETYALTTGDLNARFGRYQLSSSVAADWTIVTASSPKNTVQFGTNDSANQGAFEDSYSKWNGELRIIAKDHSIVPEYRISEHIGNIVDNGYDISNDSYQALSLTGSQATANSNVFLESFAHSDDIPAIEIVREIQERDAKRISINISAAKKLLPYDGFYPVQRTLQLSTLFSQSLGPNARLQGADASFQTLNNVIFSRLTYGSIRAGVATDSANWISGSIITAGEITPAYQQKWNRIPFEAIVDPASHLNVSSSIIENDYENPFNSTASVGYIDPKYGLAASNFYAGVVDTFVQDSTLTSIKSKPASEWTFSQGNFDNYSMDIVVSKNSSFTNHDDPSANGYPYAVHSCFYQALSSSTDGGFTWTDSENEGTVRTEGLVQPNASWTYNEAIVNVNFDYAAFRTAITEREPTLNDILFYSTKTYKNKQMVDSDLPTSKGLGTSSFNSSSPFMTIEAGVDLFASNNKSQWTPTLRWECPVHNYVGVSASFPDGTDGGTGVSGSDVNRGVWHQYSTNTNSGLKLFARSPDTETSRTTGSLAEAVGFEMEQKVVSQLATSTQLKEFLVVVPFVTNECEEEVFFHYPINQFERAYQGIDNENRSTLSDMLALQRELILPPKLNYMVKRDSADKRLEQDNYGPILPPFAMYIFEVTQDLSQEDLSKWWQGVLPSAGTKISMEKFNIAHEIKEGEIISPSVLNNDLFGGKLPKEMRFKVFKAKYKRNLTYSEIKNKSINEAEPINSIFGYNYPHDFYSLIEMAKVDLGLEYEGDEE